MLDADLTNATRVFCYNLCFDKPFLRLLEQRLLTQLPVGAYVLLRGQGFQAPEDHDGARQGSSGKKRKRLELRLRMTFFFGYRVVQDDDLAPVARVQRPALRQCILPLGTSRFERAVFVNS